MSENQFDCEQGRAWLAPNIAARSSVLTSYKTDLTGLPPYQLRQVVDYINNRLEQNLGVEELAAIAKLSQFHFARAFKRSTGMSPHQYVIGQRVERAKQLLKQHKMSISEVAIACGFSHQSHLNRHFKRLTGVTPKTFLKL